RQRATELDVVEGRPCRVQDEYAPAVGGLPEECEGVVALGSDVILALDRVDDVYRAGAEVRVTDGAIGEEAEDDLVDLGSAAPVVVVRYERDVVLNGAAVELEGSRADRRGPERHASLAGSGG